MQSFILMRKAVILFTASVFTFQMQAHAQTTDRSVSIYQYRRVPDDKINEFIKRETTYWTKVAQKAIDQKKMSFWALFEKVGGYDMPNSSNFLFINTFPNVDSAGAVFGAAEKITGMKMAQIETNSISTTTSEFFVKSQDWAQAKDAVPAKDFNYVVMIYHGASSQDSLINLEKTYWHPFIQKAMDDHMTTQKAWGDATVLAPSGGDIKYNTVSFDLYKNLTDALMPDWNPATVFPTDGLNKIQAIENVPRASVIYRVVKVVSSN